MTNFLRFRPVLTGFIGAPGINTWHGEAGEFELGNLNAQEFAASVHAAYDAMKSRFASDVVITFPGEVTEHVEETGALVRVHAVPTGDPIASTGGAGTSNLSRANQIVVRLLTDITREGRRLNGRHFIGPINTAQLGANGQITAQARESIEFAYQGVLDAAGGHLVVWGPPRGAPGDAEFVPGKKATVQSVAINSTPGTLRSRKV